MLLLARHAEDRGASEARFGDEGLSERGREQARALGERLRERALRGCLCSPLARARETADLAVSGRGIEIEIEPDLAEGSVGGLAGLSHEQARERHAGHFALGASVVARLAARGETAPGGEPREAFLARARRVAARLERELAERSEGDLLIVAHGGLLNYALMFLTGVPPRDEVPFGFDHCGVVRAIAYGEAPSFGPFPMLRFGLG